MAGRNDRGPVDWPPAPIRTERLVLREPEARDHAAFIELLASPEVHSYLGGPRPRDELEREVSGVPERWPRSFVVELDGSMIGQILLRRATGHRRPAAAGKVDLGYLFLPRAWGFGYAAEVCAAALGRLNFRDGRPSGERLEHWLRVGVVHQFSKRETAGTKSATCS
ncbi:GNAT family N-acetyltransferase [Streptomyces sp. NPDC086796]|uniref:GNAT family N-acetyltransferase n=1 Tax=unclassified Streptomyces TaxID=2593676 RepID=UPI003829072E